MPPFPFPLPTTSLISYANLLHDTSLSFTAELAEATSARTTLQLALKALDENNPSASALSVVDAVQGYLPYLQSIIHSLDSDLLLPKSELSFTWTPSLTSYPLKTPALTLPSIHAEHLFVLLVYALSLSNYANSILRSLPVFESIQDSKGKSKAGGAAQSVVGRLTAEDEKKITVGLGRAVDLLCQASGIATYVADKICPVFEGAKKGAGRNGKLKWPVETGAEAFRGLAMVFLADAHVTAIRKLLLPVLTHSLFSPPGPPLPSNHPSPSLLAKLYLHTASLYESARAFFKVRGGESSSNRKLFSRDKKTGDTEPHDTTEGDPIPELQRYLRKESLLASALARKWLGVDAGENSKEPQTGEALAWVKDAQSRLEELEDSAVREKMKGFSLSRGGDKKKEARKARKGRVERELEDVRAWIASYQALNDKVSFQPVPPSSSLVVPSGRQVFNAKTFVPPPNKFGSTFKVPLDGSTPDSEGAQNASPTEAYAGQGNYF
ncbi:hypothetical protein BD324DRAFT_578025 [Kockovaella imperatae]|uniref:pH-response regulator protein palC n=1 Tax=Kockovaella imperatae TaxID=4999 RepID=A0A1Y1UKF3_9TREE|nr:hypothetical protein BD324DRAFT_578025 [Kockovaella imperatae]ORX38531.1 hypothetical protein BD324DRAFT_578025 [Kockovaella imperatae]